jgi:hypothetical protein
VCRRKPRRARGCVEASVTNSFSATRPSSSSASQGRRGSPTPTPRSSSPTFTVWPAHPRRKTPAAVRVHRKWLVLLVTRRWVLRGTDRCRAAVVDTRGLAPTGGACPQRIQRKSITTVVEPQPTVAQRLDALHPGKITGGLFDHRAFGAGFEHPHQQFSAHIEPASSRVVVRHDRNADKIAHAEKILINFAFRKPPVRRRQDHHRIGAGAFCLPRARGRLCCRQARAAWRRRVLSPHPTRRRHPV